MDLFRNRRWDLVGRAWLWYTISLVIMLAGVPTWMIKGLNLGVDFTGGAILKYQFEQPFSRAPNGELGAMQIARQVASSLKTPQAYPKSQVQVADQKWLILRIPELDSDRQQEAQRNLKTALEEKLSAHCGKIVEASDVEFVGPVVGQDLRRGARNALILGIGLILIYVSVRYRFRFAVAAILALLHDVLVICGGMALLRVELNSPFVAAILTVVGYSINDTVVIFDRIRENMTLHRQAPFANTVNASLLQTMARSVNTVLTTLFTLIALALFGGATIRPFAVALIIGISSGCYSSIFVASQLLVTWQRMWENGAANKLWWRALLACAPAVLLGLVGYPILSLVGLQPVVQQAGLIGHVAIAVILWGLGLYLTKYFSVSALRVLAGVPATRGGLRVTAARPPLTPMVRSAAIKTDRGLSAEGAMVAASAAAVEERREERRERRKQRKLKEHGKQTKRKKRF
ncbi:MAG: protein translocase subunit SecF [Candidatus Zipacnadales bacterium]